MIELIVPPEDQNLRLDVFLSRQADIASRSQAARLIESAAVSVNSKPETAKSRLLAAGDVVAYQLAELTPPPGLLPEHIPLDICYEDEYLMVISKPAGMVCHPARGYDSGTLVNALIGYCGYGNLALLQGDDRPGIVHRLDKDTSGLMLAAKSNAVGRILTDALRLREVKRRYLTLVHGYIASETGLIDAPLSRGMKERTRYMVSDEPGARSAVTSFTVLERFEAGRDDDGYCLLECRLFTGRTHQIRVHMAYTHHPCVGDQLYGRPRRRQTTELGLERQFLHSSYLEFVHPVSKQEMRFSDALPEDLLSALDLIRSQSMGLTTVGEQLQPLFCRQS